MAIPLTLGVPRSRGPRSLLADLLCATQEVAATDIVASATTDSATPGPRVISASTLLENPGTDLGRIIVALDIDPVELRTREPASYEAVRFHLDCTSSDLGDALALRLPSPLAVFVAADEENVVLAETAQQLTTAGRIPGLDTGYSVGEVADFLAVLAHADTGYVARARDGAEILALLAGTVAALRGDDVRAALARPEPAKLTALIPEAAEALREVLLGIEIADPEEASRELVAAGLR